MRTAASLRPQVRADLDATAVLTIYLVALVAIPSRLVIGPLGGAGSPAGVVGMGCLAWWLWSTVQRPAGTGAGRQPVRIAMLCTVGAFAASYIAAMVRPIEGPEFSTAHLALVLLCGWSGVLFVANDGIVDMDRLLVLVRRVVAAGGVMATLGVAQFVTGQPIVDRISVPGLSANHSMFGLTQREGFSRPSGTATHPIEYGAVVTMILPLALALAMNDGSRGRLRRWYPAVVIILSIPLSISRSALVAAFVGFIVLAVTWPPVTRRIAALALVVLAGFVYVAVPGMLGSLLGLFTSIGGDSSAQSRTGSYAIAGEFIEKAPVFGRGFGTFLPGYRILDNQYLGLLIEVGIVGLASVLCLIAAAFWCARRARAISEFALHRQAFQGIAAAVCAGAISLALFDGLSFPMSAGMFFLVLGLAGAAWRLARQLRESSEHAQAGVGDVKSGERE